MQQYFQRELNYLREQGSAFAAANPAMAPGLGALSTDPDVARLLEGVAFLTAQIAQQTDAWLPELAHDLLDVVAPELHDATPSQTIVQIEADRRRFRATHVIDSGVNLDIVAPHGALCRFRTTRPCTLDGVRKLTTQLHRRGQNGHTLSIQVDVQGAKGAASLPGTCSRVFVSGEYRDASNLWLAIVKHALKATLRIDDETHDVDAQRHFVAVDCDGLHTVDGTSQDAGRGAARMRSYFNLPQTALFFDIVWPADLQQYVGVARFRLELTLDAAHGLDAAIAADLLRLGCVPAVNLFQGSAMPVRWQPLGGPQLLRAESVGNRDVALFRVESVEGICNKSFKKTVYRPFRDGHGFRGECGAAYYHTHRRPSATQTAPDTFIDLHTPEDHMPQLRAQTLSVKLTCTNGAAAGGIGPRASCRLLGTDGPLSAHTVCAASKPLGAPGLHADSWLLLGHMASLRPNSDLRVYLQQLLGLLVRAFDPHSAHGRAHARRIEGIERVDSQIGYQMHRGLATRCETIRMQLNTDCFISLGDAYIFADIINALLAEARGINQPHVLQVVMMPSAQSYRWPCRGMQA